LKLAGLNPDEPLEGFKGNGCLACRNTGYNGRIGIYEFLLVDVDISDLVLQEAPAYHIRELAMKNGMITLLEDGVTKIKRGDTSLSEIYETLGTTRIITS
jgi:type II secretory ATPase GspE/PulE/Tfp pilus assembly ATPase PilB-like protein